MKWLCALLLLLPAPVLAESLVAARLIRPSDVIAPGDVTRSPAVVAGAANALDQVVGLEARVAIYPGRPIRLADLGPAAVVERNEVVRMIYRRGGLMIQSDGRAMARAGVGDAIQVMNLSSRQSVQGVVTAAGLVEITGHP